MDRTLPLEPLLLFQGWSPGHPDPQADALSSAWLSSNYSGLFRYQHMELYFTAHYSEEETKLPAKQTALYPLYSGLGIQVRKWALFKPHAPFPFRALSDPMSNSQQR